METIKTKTYAMIKNSQVINIIIADEGAKEHEGCMLIETNEPIEIGDTYDGFMFIKKDQAEEE